MFANRVQETSTVVGTGVIDLQGAVTGYRTFASACANGDTFGYTIESNSGTEWEVGTGQYNSIANTITRSAVENSSNANALVNFSAGPKKVYIVLLASKIGSGGNVTADTHPTTANAADDEFEVGATIDTTGARVNGATAWSWVNQGTSTAVVTNGSLVLTSPASAGPNVRMVVLPTVGSTWKYRCKLASVVAPETNTRDVGILVRNSSNSKHISISQHISSSVPVLSVQRWTSPTVFNLTVLNDATIFAATLRNDRMPLYLEIEQTATNLLLRYSDSGIEGTFILFVTEALSTFITSVDRVGVFSNSQNSADTIGIFDWFRKIA